MSAPVRIQRKRTKGWRMSEGAIYVGRPSIYGNPFPVGIRVSVPTLNGTKAWNATADLVKVMFRLWAKRETVEPNNHAAAHVRLMAALERGDLRGKDLVCWCALDVPCHADVLLELANESPS